MRANHAWLVLACLAVPLFSLGAACGPGDDCYITRTCPSDVDATGGNSGGSTTAAGGATTSVGGAGGTSAATGGTGPGGGAPALSDQRIDGGDGHTCFVAFGADLYCWGDGMAGQLGNGTFDGSPEPVMLSMKATRVATGSNHSCAEIDGSLSCWGGNGSGQLGTGNTSPQSLPTAITGLNGVSSIGLGTDHSCAAASGGAWCWGSDASGQVGDGGNVGGTQPSPVVTNVATALSVAASGAVSCAVDGGNEVSCWGQLPAIGPSPSPVPQNAIASATAVVAGDQFMCALLVDETMRCWGEGGIPGIGITPSNPGLTNVKAIAAGAEHVCAVVNQTVSCWGQNDFGQLGIGALPAQASPQVVAGVSDVIDVGAGADHTCVVITDDSVQCWGRNHRGQLGDGSFDSSSYPVTVAF